mmetsp:Transcript_18109/g.62548  ORF Transcript_18109/g.62548 Transcript_18109/m.62548 type:complete len:84 (-) Transcript_18109:140-391(-)|eukprot:CAMPEP_0184121264 /NCGR_PEP_ID=MMETSP0974-20121125/22881_1 /TAXON_ID=483370 /ORGANISM="non described non described, Strain CCMP2097" /LENGTH=83 /DNA_ID=CAMNT_0026424463 /DNA_START=9 /DNA_END=260 /DNA_ORIENTATION=+
MVVIEAVAALVGLSLCAVFAEAMHDKEGAPRCAPRCCAGYLGVFEACCGPFDAMLGYRSARPRALYNGLRRSHGFQYQGLSSP